MIKLHVAENPSATMHAAAGNEATITMEQMRVIRAVSPTIDAERTTDGAVLTIHDIDGDEQITIYDGEKGDGGTPAGGNAGDLLVKRSGADYDVEWITPATTAERDNTRPITSAAVYTEIGNINALLATI